MMLDIAPLQSKTGALFGNEVRLQLRTAAIGRALEAASAASQC